MKILLDTCACIFYVSDNVMTRVHLANIILVHIIMLLFKSHPVYRQLKKVSKNMCALINMVRHFPVLHFPDRAIPCEVVRHFPVLHFQVVHFQSPPLPCQWKKIKKSVNISQGYNQERGCLVVHILPLSQLWSWVFGPLFAVMLSLGLGLKTKFFGLGLESWHVGLGLEPCGLVNNVIPANF